METNAVRFINAYNQIDQSLRAIYNFKRNITFSDMIRRAVSLNSVVRKYEDKLIDYARLRNAIIHNSNEDKIIAEPHDEVVEIMEKIAGLISQPPLALETVATKNVLVLDGNTSIKSALETIYKTGYKTIPVFENEVIMGVITASRIANVLGAQIEKGRNIEEFASFTEVGSVISEQDAGLIFTICSRELSVQEALDLFFHNRKLLAIIITKNGNNLERPLGIITAADIMDLNKVVDDYDV
ncbi:MAG: CBS domain-containing protein [Clostridia bacterium]|nr:CBS domain-containing protein [Clostridia bacterium]